MSCLCVPSHCNHLIRISRYQQFATNSIHRNHRPFNNEKYLLTRLSGKWGQTAEGERVQVRVCSLAFWRVAVVVLVQAWSVSRKYDTLTWRSWQSLGHSRRTISRVPTSPPGVYYCTVLYCSVLYCTVLYCTGLSVLVLQCDQDDCWTLRGASTAPGSKWSCWPRTETSHRHKIQLVTTWGWLCSIQTILRPLSNISRFLGTTWQGGQMWPVIKFQWK